VQYQTYYITDFLEQGENIIDVSLGNGIYKGRLGLDRKDDIISFRHNQKNNRPV